MSKKVLVLLFFVAVIVTVGVGYKIVSDINNKPYEAYENLAERTYSGKIVKIKDNRITVELNNGKNKTFTLTDDSYVQYGTEIGDYVKEIKKGRTVNILSRNGGKIELIHLQQNS